MGTMREAQPTEERHQVQVTVEFHWGAIVYSFLRLPRLYVVSKANSALKNDNICSHTSNW